MNIGRTAWTIVGALVLAGVGQSGAFAEVKQSGPFCTTSEPWLVRPGTEEHGDRYIVGASGISMDGIQNGDLFGWSQKISIDGELNGDLFAGAYTIDISGTVRDSARVFGQNVDIDGTIEGDLVVFAAALNLEDGAHITGDVFGTAAHFTHRGRVDGSIRLTTGESTIDGHVGKDLRLKADTISIGELATIDGDLTYTSRTELPAGAADHVAGEIIHNEVLDKEEADAEDDEFTVGTVIKWLYWPVAAFIVGTILLALSGRHKLLPIQHMNEEGWTGLAIGLFALPVLAVASAVALILVLTIPLGVIGLFLLVLLAFVGKIPAAIWLGSRILGLRGGNGSPSPYLSLALGLPIAYLLFSIPYFIGLALWYVATSAGIGALILAIVALRQSGEQTSAVET